MTLQEHKDHLTYLKTQNDIGRVIPKREGAFYFGRYISMPEYIERYESEVNNLTKRA